MTPETSLVAAVRALSDRAVEVRALFAEFERGAYGHEWSVSELMAGFVVDVGDLTRLVMASQGSRHVDRVDEALAHELADCLWSVLVLGICDPGDLRIGGAVLLGKIERVDRVVPGVVQVACEPSWELCIDEELHAAPSGTRRIPAVLAPNSSAASRSSRSRSG